MAKYDIAIIGMGGIFPEANNVQEYWKNIVSGKQFTRDMDEKLWYMDQYCGPDTVNFKSYTKKGCFLKEFDFNAFEYNIPPKNFEGMDKSQMVMLEATKEALYDAGIKPHSKELKNAITAIGCSGVDDYAHVSLFLNRRKYFKKLIPDLKKEGFSDKEIEVLFEEFSENIEKRGHKWHPSLSAIGSVGSSISNRIAQVFGARNFNMTNDGACGSSFVSISVACHALMAGDARVAITGGVDLGVNPAIYIGFSRLGGLSKKGFSNPFDHSADGLVVGEGGGVVILKRLEDAIADKDRIHAVIKGIGASSDGAGQAIYNPCVKQRCIALQKALDVSGIKPEQIQYLEAHATSTKVGDANEYDAISHVYGNRPIEDPLYLGTVKHQIGHLKAAAGVAGLIKTVMAMKRGKIPHMPNFNKLTELAEHKSDALVIPTSLQDWIPRENGSRYSSVTTSGFGGVNYHLILEQAEQYTVSPRENIERSVAIVAVSNRLPGADTPEKFWDNTTAGKDIFQDVNPEKLGWEEVYKIKVGPDIIETPQIALLDDYAINNLKYKIPPKSISQMSPTQLLAVEMADRLLESYGLEYTKNKNIGISIGSMHDDNYSTISFPQNTDEYAESIKLTNSYKNFSQRQVFDNILSQNRRRIHEIGPPNTETTLPGWMSNINAGIIANRLNCNGPNFTVDTACSSGIASLIPAMYQLMFSDVDMMIAGGLNRHTSNTFISAVSAIGAIATDKARPFDEEGKGFIIGEGGSLFLLKRLKDAQKDNDNIVAVINNVGGSSEYASKTMVAPSEESFKLAIENGLSKSGIRPNQIGVIDTHGSANKISDIIEATSIAKVLRKKSTTPPVHITAIKSHIGHSFGGSGAAGLLSVIKTLQTKQVPGIRNLSEVRSELKGLSDKVVPQKGNGILEAQFNAGGVTSLGLGGANYFAVVSLPSANQNDNGSKSLKKGENKTIDSPTNNNSIYVCYADSEADLKQKLSNQINTESITSYTEKKRICLTTNYSDNKTLIQKLKTTYAFLERNASITPLKAQGVYLNINTEEEHKCAFVFPGQGTHYIGMGKSLYNSSPLFKDIIDKVDSYAIKRFQFELKEYLYGNMEETIAMAKLSSIEGAQISLFAVSLATAKLLESRGVKPNVMTGHSFGEIVALCHAGAWDLETAFEVVAARIDAANLIASKSDLKMLSLICSETQKDALLTLAGDDVVLSNINAPGQFIISGKTATVKKLAEIAESFEIESKLLKISTAFHSRFMEDAVEPFRQVVAQLPSNPLTIPILSTITGEYWHYSNSEELAETLSKQLTTQLNMPREINTLFNEGYTNFLEVGPRWALSKMIEATLEDKQISAVPTLHPKVGDSEMFARAQAFLTSINRLSPTTPDISLSMHNLDSDFFIYLKNNEPAIIALLEEAQKRYQNTATNQEHTQESIKSNTPKEPVSTPIVQKSPLQTQQTETITSQSEEVADNAVWLQRAKAKLAETTGYPEDMLGEDLDLEADLGIDSVQRAEIWVSLVDEFKLDEEYRPESIKTLTQLANELSTLAGYGIATPVVQNNQETVETLQPTIENHQVETSDITVWLNRAKAKLAETTGYPEDMLGEDLDLEADLGIDSVQRAEIWVSLVDEFKLDEEYRPDSIKTLNQLASELSCLAAHSTTVSENKITPIETSITDKQFSESKADITQPSQSNNIKIWVKRAKAKLAETTGYPEDMLGETLDLEADLGIDSVQRAEIWVSLVDEYSLDEEYRPESIKSLQQLAEELNILANKDNNSATAISQETIVNNTTDAIKETNDTIAVWVGRAKAKLAETTGYPEDMLGENLDLEADLGIDSVQRAEIWVSLVDEYKLDEEYRPESIKSLQQLAEELFLLSNTESTTNSYEESPQQSTSISEEVIKEEGCELFESTYQTIDNSEITAFDCKHVFVITAHEDETNRWKNFFASKSITAIVATYQSVINADEIALSNTIKDCDTILLVSYLDIFKSISAGNTLTDEVLTETKHLYAIFKKLAQSIRSNDIRIICPIKQDGAFGSANKSFMQQGSFPAGFIRSLQHEIPAAAFKIYDMGENEIENAVEKILPISIPFHEIGLVNDEFVRILLQRVPTFGQQQSPLSPNDLVLVTGGARGIVFECVAELAKQTKCDLLLTGRTALPSGNEPWLNTSKELLDSEMMMLEITMVKEQGLNLGEAKKITAQYKTQHELYNNLKMLSDNGISYMYEVCDVSNSKAFTALINKIQQTRKIVGVVHGAGIQKSKLFEDLSPEAIDVTIKTKLSPLFILEQALDLSQLKLFSGFGSIAGLFGNAGQSDYALGNDMLAAALTSLAHKHNIFAQTVEWTAWSGTGMVSKEETKRFKASGLIPVEVKKGVELYIKAILNSRANRVAVFNEGASFSANRPIIDNTKPSGTIVSSSKLAKLLNTDSKSAHFDLERDEYINQHLVQDNPVVPGTFTTELFLESIEGTGKTIKNVVFKRPLWIRNTQMDIDIVAAENTLLAVPNIRPDLPAKALETLSFAKCETTEKSLVPEDSVLTCNDDIKNRLTAKSSESTSPFYTKLDNEFSWVLKSGPVFRGVTATEEIDGVFYGLVNLTDEALSMFELQGEFVINPVLADMAIQTASVWGINRFNKMAIPFGIGKIHVYNQATMPQAIVICKEHQINENESKTDIIVRQIDGKLLFVMEEAILKTLPEVSNK